jgi:hypothetical protein
MRGITMIFTVIRVASKVATAAWVAKNGYEVYKKGAAVYKTYKKVKSVGTGAKGLAKEVGKRLKK